MPVICIILLTLLSILVVSGLMFLLCKYIDQTGEKFVKKIQEKQAGYYFCQLEAIRKKKKEKEKLISCLNSQETERQKKKGEKPCSDLSEKEERKEGNKEHKEEEKKPSSDLSKTIPRSYSTTLPGFERIQQRKPNSYSDLLNTEEWRNKRLKIIKRDNCRCVYCGNRFHLHVHHKYYSAYPNGVLVDPWNYPDDALITLCAYCHQRVHARKKIKVYHRRYTDNY